jgi:two-component system NarL family sensor kinase
LEDKGQIDIAGLIIIATMGILVLIFFIIFIVLLYQKRMLSNKTQMISSEKEHQKQLLDASLEIAEQERRKIAANLHDDIGITLNVVKINLSRLKKNISSKEIIDEIVSESNKMIDGSIDTVRTIYNDIIPPTLIKLGFIKGIKEICRQINASGAVNITLNPAQESLELEKNKELQLYRLIKEVLNNTIRHAKPQFIEINIELIENSLIVIILHDGMGITTNEIRKLAEKSTGIGLKSIFTRTGLLNADISFSTGAKGNPQVIIKCKV